MKKTVEKITDWAVTSLVAQAIIFNLLPLVFVMCESFAIIPAGSSTNYLLNSFIIGLNIDLVGAVVVLALNVITEF